MRDESGYPAYPVAVNGVRLFRKSTGSCLTVNFIRPALMSVIQEWVTSQYVGWKVVSFICNDQRVVEYEGENEEED